MPLYSTRVGLNSGAITAGTQLANGEYIAGVFKTYLTPSDLTTAIQFPLRFDTGQIVYVSSSNELFSITKTFNDDLGEDIVTTSSFSFPSTGSGGSGTPGGSPGEIQFNDGGSFGGDPRFIFAKSTGLTQLSGSLQITGSTDNLFLIKSSSVDLLRVSSSGALVFGDLQHTPPPVAGGFFYSSSAFYVGIE